ncbi:AAA ATPase, central domain protein [Ruegeria lacuscaerulensis ITI-1157]|nr:AAA ATPase, central domain protein [Ruegeria lacuscaerulensis ITI-1157]
MPQTPRPAPAGALSPHALSLLRPLLRRIALWHRDLSADLQSDNGPDDDESDTGPARPDVRSLPPFLRMDEPYSATPAAHGMRDRDITRAIADGRDPWAEADGTGQINRLPDPPIDAMVAAARFAALFDSPEDVAAVTGDRALTVIVAPSSEDRRLMWAQMDSILGWLADLDAPGGARWRGIDTPIPSATERDRAPRRGVDGRNAVASSVRQGRKAICFLPDTGSMSEIERALCRRIFTLPPLSREICIEILRATHSATGRVAEDALRDRLPADGALAALPLPVIEGAYCETTTLAVADALADAAARMRRPAGITLADVVLNAEVQEPIDRLVADVRAWMSGQLGWDEVSSSVLLFGPPGNGKTLLASAIAGSIGGPLVATSYSDCQKHGHQGDMLRALSEKAEAAIRSVPSVFFLDELDSFTHRNAAHRRSDYIVGVVNGLLEHLSRLNDTAGVVVLGATNFPDMVDPAVIRPGRFDLKLEMGNPDRAALVRILRLALGDDADDLNLSPLADQLLGLSGAQVTALVRDARGLARAAGHPLQQRHLEAAARRIAPPPDTDFLWRAAIHEARHMVVGTACGLGLPERAVLTVDGGSVEYPRPRIETRQTAQSRLSTLLAGYAAERLVFGEVSSGAGNGPGSDLARATDLARRMRFEWGMGDRLTHLPASGAILRPGDAVDRAVQDVLGTCLEQAHGILRQNRDRLTAVAEALLTERELSKERCREVVEGFHPNNAKPAQPEPAIHNPGPPESSG